MAGKLLEASAVVFLIFASFAALSSLGKAVPPAQYHAAAEIYPQGSGSGLDADKLDGNETTKNAAATTGIPIIDAAVTYANLRAGYATSAGSATSATSAGSVPWSGISGIPAGFADNVDNVGGGIAVESDPTVAASVKDGVSWSEISGIPAGFADNVDDTGGGGGGGTVTSVSAGTGLSASPNPITGSGTISADTGYLQRRVSGTCAPGASIRVINADGSVSCETDDVGAGGGISGSGTANYLAKWTGGTSLGNSIITEGAGSITVNGRIVSNDYIWSVGTIHAVNPVSIAAQGYIAAPKYCIGGDCITSWPRISCSTYTTSVSCSSYKACSNFAFCPTGKTMTGGGCNYQEAGSATVSQSSPYENGWYCYISNVGAASPMITYVRCCQ